jgi:hypothetical protein
MCTVLTIALSSFAVFFGGLAFLTLIGDVLMEAERGCTGVKLLDRALDREGHGDKAVSFTLTALRLLCNTKTINTGLLVSFLGFVPLSFHPLSRKPELKFSLPKGMNMSLFPVSLSYLVCLD